MTRPPRLFLAALVLAASCTAPAHRDRAASPRLSAAGPLPGPALIAVPRPPQFVVISFDGAGSPDLWQSWRDVARANAAHFTFFLSAVYLLTRDARAEYHPPRHEAGASDIGVVPAPHGVDDHEYERALREQITTGMAEGHELASHFGGHFCGAKGVATWSTADWIQELDAVDHLLTRAGLDPSYAGVRTPCLEGQVPELATALRERHVRYDASATASVGDWPRRTAGVWRFPLAAMQLTGTHRHVLSMDYNLYVNQTDAHDVTGEDASRVQEQAYQAFVTYFENSYRGNRAPVSIGLHFTHWNDSAYIAAGSRFIHDECTRPEVRCTSYRELTDWLDTQSPAALASYAAGHFAPADTTTPG